MTDPRHLLLAADLLLILHAAFVAFVVLGLCAIVVGKWRGWAWVSNRGFRLTHLLAIGFVAAQAWLGRLCPLTVWEDSLRRRAGLPGYSETFVQHWLHQLLYFSAERWVFTALYTVVAALVLALWWRDRGRR